MDDTMVARSETGDPLLLTPGPLTTSKSVKAAMVHDWGSRDADFLKMNREVLQQLPSIVNGRMDYVAVPVQGSGTFAVEAMLTSCVPADGCCLLIVNGAYGHRAGRILDIAKRRTVVCATPEDTPPDLERVEQILNEDPGITHIFAVHCETTSGIVNPVHEIGALAAKYRKAYLIDAMSAFGALALDAPAAHADAVAASSNKCIEGVPGLGFVICRKAMLEPMQGNATTLTLDLYDQWSVLEKTGQYRFTPPIHVIVAFHQALQEFFAEGGQPGRGGRYTANCKVLIDGMRAMGFETLLPDILQAPIIVTFRMPIDERFVFQSFYDRLKERGFVIYPGKLTVADSFRIGCIGRIDQDQMRMALAAIRAVVAELGVRSVSAGRAAMEAADT